MRYRFWNRPLSLFVMLACAFAAGILVERSGRLFAPFHYPPPGVEKTFAPFWETWHLVNRYYVKRDVIDPEHMTRGAIRGLLFGLGDFPHTRYLTPEDLTALKNGLEGRLEGIGARMSLRKRRPTIVNTIPGSPARAAGLRPGDIILEVNDVDVSSMPLDQIISIVRGPAGEPVHFKIEREGSSEPLSFEIMRAQVEVPDVTWALLPGVPIAHVAIQNFGKETDKQIKTALEAIRQKGAKGLILDVRGNPGGIKDQAVAVTSEFLTSGDVFIEQDAQGQRKAVPVVQGAAAPDIPLCVLIDQGTASSAEIFAGAIQDHKRGKLVGTTTTGTGTVLQPFQLSDGSAVLLAISEWLTPDGRQIWHKGITPDISMALPEGALILMPEAESDLTTAALAKTEDKQLLKALEVLKEQIR
jgi:carboxyl-terminal processing protease